MDKGLGISVFEIEKTIKDIASALLNMSIVVYDIMNNFNQLEKLVESFNYLNINCHWVQIAS